MSNCVNGRRFLLCAVPDPHSLALASPAPLLPGHLLGPQVPGLNSEQLFGRAPGSLSQTGVPWGWEATVGQQAPGEPLPVALLGSDLMRVLPGLERASSPHQEDPPPLCPGGPRGRGALHREGRRGQFQPREFWDIGQMPSFQPIQPTGNAKYDLLPHSESTQNLSCHFKSEST